jgi:hypothetical protein
VRGLTLLPGEGREGSITEAVWDGNHRVRSSPRDVAEMVTTAGSHISCLKAGLLTLLAHGVGTGLTLGDMVVLMVPPEDRQLGALMSGLEI